MKTLLNTLALCIMAIVVTGCATNVAFEQSSAPAPVMAAPITTAFGSVCDGKTFPCVTGRDFNNEPSESHGGDSQ